jgi:hypothetical protein
MKRSRAGGTNDDGSNDGTASTRFQGTSQAGGLMTTGQMRKLIEKVERWLYPTESETQTMDDLAWSIWRQDKKEFLKLCDINSSLRLFIPIFEREDEEAAAREMRSYLRSQQ